MRTVAQTVSRQRNAAVDQAVGIALHYFDPEQGARGAKHDKFYRLYLYKGAGGYLVTSNWGRDGAFRGQLKTESFATHAAALRYMKKLADSKIKKGYEYLGEAPVGFNIANLYQTGENLLLATGRRPSKETPFRVIEEEPDLLEALMG